jgi:hypothetical protein
MLLEALIRLLHAGEIVAGRRVATSADCSAWLGIYPLSLERPTTHEILRREGIRILPGADVRAYRVSTFEIPLAIADSYFSEAELQNKWSVVVLGDEALLKILSEMGIDLADLDSPRNVDYPL